MFRLTVNLCIYSLVRSLFLSLPPLLSDIAIITLNLKELGLFLGSFVRSLARSFTIHLLYTSELVFSFLDSFFIPLTYLLLVHLFVCTFFLVRSLSRSFVSLCISSLVRSLACSFFHISFPFSFNFIFLFFTTLNRSYSVVRLIFVIFRSSF